MRSGAATWATKSFVSRWCGCRVEVDKQRCVLSNWSHGWNGKGNCSAPSPLGAGRAACSEQVCTYTCVCGVPRRRDCPSRVELEHRTLRTATRNLRPCSQVSSYLLVVDARSGRLSCLSDGTMLPPPAHRLRLATLLALLLLARRANAVNWVYDEMLWTKQMWEQVKSDNPLRNANPSDQDPRLAKELPMLKDSLANSVDGPYERRDPYLGPLDLE
eukprot:365782-Chlamydomonas_euryale.AAC.5